MYSILLSLRFFLAGIIPAQGNDQKALRPAEADVFDKAIGQRPLVIPFAYDPLFAPYPIIQMRINGEEPISLIVDTGFNGNLIITRRAAARIGLKALKDRPVGMEDKTKKVFRASVHSVAIVCADQKAVAVQDVDEVGVDDSDWDDMHAQVPGGIAGAIGTQLLEGSTVQFDFSAKTMMFWGKPHPPLHIPGATVLPLRGSVAETHLLFFVGFSANREADFELLVDTGSACTIIPAAMAFRLSPSTIIAETRQDSHDRYHMDLKMLLPTLRVGEFDEPNVPVSVTFDESATPPRLGADLLSRFRVTLDFGNGCMILERSADYSRRLRLKGWTGIYWSQENGKYVVGSVDEGSPADNANVWKNDAVAEIDGQRLSSLSPYAAFRTLQGFADSRAELVLERPNASKIRVAFQRKSEFDRPLGSEKGFVGTVIEKSQEGRIMISSVAKESPSEKKGLRAGDEVVEVDGLKVRGMSCQGFLSHVGDKKTTLKIRRKGEKKLREVKLKAEKED